jgi:hypothetical protein
MRDFYSFTALQPELEFCFSQRYILREKEAATGDIFPRDCWGHTNTSDKW